MIARHVKKEMQHVEPATMTSRCTKAMHITIFQLPKFIIILHIMHWWLLNSMKSHINAVKNQEAVVLKVNHVVVLTITMNTSIINLHFLFITTLGIKMETMELFVNRNLKAEKTEFFGCKTENGRWLRIQHKQPTSRPIKSWIRWCQIYFWLMQIRWRFVHLFPR